MNNLYYLSPDTKVLELKLEGVICESGDLMDMIINDDIDGDSFFD